MMHIEPTTSPGGRPCTLTEWVALDEDEPGEVVDGQLVEEEVPEIVHEVCVSWLIWVLRSWLAPRKGGLVIGSEAKFGVAPRRGRKPDASVYLPGGRRPPGRGLVRVPPDIMVEVVSPLPRDVRRDRLDKMGDYAGFGVHWYWILDPEARTLEIFELGPDGRYAFAAGGSEGQLVVPGCEGLVLDLDALWREVEQLAETE